MQVHATKSTRIFLVMAAKVLLGEATLYEFPLNQEALAMGSAVVAALDTAEIKACVLQ